MRRADDHRPWSVRLTPAGLRPGDRPSAGARRTAGRLPAAPAEREPRPIHQQGSKDPSQPMSWRIARLAARLLLRALNAPYQSPNVTCSGKTDESATARKLAWTVSLNSQLSAAGISQIARRRLRGRGSSDHGDCQRNGLAPPTATAGNQRYTARPPDSAYEVPRGPSTSARRTPLPVAPHHRLGAARRDRKRAGQPGSPEGLPEPGHPGRRPKSRGGQSGHQPAARFAEAVRNVRRGGADRSRPAGGLQPAGSRGKSRQPSRARFDGRAA